MFYERTRHSHTSWQSDGPKPTLEELNTYVDDAGYRLPQSLDEGFFDRLTPTFTTAEAIDVGKRGALSENAAKRRIRNWVNAKFIRKLERGKYAKCMQKQLRSGVNATN